MAARLLGYRGTVVDSGDIKSELAALAELHPLGSRIRHACGREGTVTLDQPAHVPGFFDGKPTAWCYENQDSNRAWIFASWDNERGLDSWLVWVPMDKVQPANVRRAVPTVQHPNVRRAINTVEIALGARRKGGAR